MQKINTLGLRPLFLSLVSLLFLSLPWALNLSFGIFFAFIPLFIMQRERVRGFLWWTLGVFTLWIFITCWWVGVATPMAYAAVPLVGLCFTFVPFALWHRFFKDSAPVLKWTVFVTMWITAEALYMYGDISFPWLTLGYAFSGNPWLVQWYSATGAFGGSLWVLLVNVMLFKRYEITGKWFLINKNEKRIIWRSQYQWIILVLIAAPSIISWVMYATYRETPNPVKIAVVQPNIDPYTEKFESMSPRAQLDKIMNLASTAPSDVDFIVAPETAIAQDQWLESLPNTWAVDTLRKFMAERYPSSTMVIGATTLQRQDKADYETYNQMGVNFKVYNSALWIDSSSQVNVYHKSKLVVGAELLPYPQFFGAMSQFINVDLGGFSGHLGRSDNREAFRQTGTAICYESVYGEFFTEYVKAGADLMFVITNDGWWGNTSGYRGLLRMSCLRAVETRRSIARSANTGISALINQRGDVVERLDWDKEGTLNGCLNANNDVTFYVRTGDYIARLSMYVLVLCVLYAVSRRFKKKN